MATPLEDYENTLKALPALADRLNKYRRDVDQRLRYAKAQVTDLQTEINRIDAAIHDISMQIVKDVMNE